MKFDAFIGGSYESQAATADQERTINLFPEIMETPGATADKALYPTPGVTQLDAATTGYARAHQVMACRSSTCMDSASQPQRMPPKWSDGREFLVIGNTLFEANSAGELIEKTSVDGGPDNAFEGTVNPSTSKVPATLSDGFDILAQWLLVTEDKAYTFSASGEYVHKIDALDGIATMGGFLDGYYLVLDAASSTLYISNLGRCDLWTTGTDYAQRSLAPDPWRAMKVFGRYIWLFGEATTELWMDTGARFPFAPVPNALINYGIAAPWSAAIVDNGLVWLSRDPAGRLAVVRALGVNVETISTYPLELAISGYDDYSDAVGWAYSDQGHTFYVLSFDESNATWVWDSRTKIWHERGVWNPITGSFDVLRSRYHAFAFGEHRVLDSEGGGLYRMGTDLTDDMGGGEIRRVRRAPAIMNENKRVFYSDFELDLEPGLGTSGQGEDPQVMMRMSDDGGKTWGNERMCSAGKMGEYAQRVRWNRLGAARRRVFEVSMTDPTLWRITGAYLNANGS